MLGLVSKRRNAITPADEGFTRQNSRFCVSVENCGNIPPVARADREYSGCWPFLEHCRAFHALLVSCGWERTLKRTAMRGEARHPGGRNLSVWPLTEVSRANLDLPDVACHPGGLQLSSLAPLREAPTTLCGRQGGGVHFAIYWRISLFVRRRISLFDGGIFDRLWREQHTGVLESLCAHSFVLSVLHCMSAGVCLGGYGLESLSGVDGDESVLEAGAEEVVAGVEGE